MADGAQMRIPDAATLSNFGQLITARGWAIRSRSRCTRRPATSRVDGSSSSASTPDCVKAWVTVVPAGISVSCQVPRSVSPGIRIVVAISLSLIRSYTISLRRNPRTRIGVGRPTVAGPFAETELKAGFHSGNAAECAPNGACQGSGRADPRDQGGGPPPGC